MSSMWDSFYERSAHLNALLNSDPTEAVKQAREISIDAPELERLNLLILRASTLVDGGALTQQQDAIEEGLALFREIHSRVPTSDITYNLANGLIAAAGTPPHSPGWVSTLKSMNWPERCWLFANGCSVNSRRVPAGLEISSTLSCQAFVCAGCASFLRSEDSNGLQRPSPTKENNGISPQHLVRRRLGPRNHP